MTLRILIAEDHRLVSQGLEAMLNLSDEVDLIGVVSTGEEAVTAIGEKEVDIVLMDVNLGAGISGIEATRRLKEKAPDVKVLILTMFTDPGTVTEAVKAGADGYLSKGASREAVVTAIKDVAEGRQVLDPNVTEGIFGRLTGRNEAILTNRELTVLQELSNGRSTKEVAQQMFVSEETVKTHLKQVFKKLNVRDRTEAVAEAFRRGLVH